MTETRTRTQRSAGKSSIRSFNGFVWRQGLFRVSQKKHFQNAVGATVHWHSEVASTPCVWKLIFRSFLTKTKPSQVMFMVKFSPTALNFCYDFVLLVHFLGHPVHGTKTITMKENGGRLLWKSLAYSFLLFPAWWYKKTSSLSDNDQPASASQTSNSTQGFFSTKNKVKGKKAKGQNS